jgi:phytoene/squalene synthetase
MKDKGNVNLGALEGLIASDGWNIIKKEIQKYIDGIEKQVYDDLNLNNSQLNALKVARKQLILIRDMPYGMIMDIKRNDIESKIDDLDPYEDPIK